MRLLLATVLLICSSATLADDDAIAALREAGKLTVESAIEPDSKVVPGQKLGLTIKIATDGWFSGGTRIKIPEVPGLVILQTAQFAANATERRGSDTWVVQRWTLDVYPQQAGSFTIGPIALQVQVQVQVGGGGGNVEGNTTSPPVSFTAAVPDALQQAQFWVAAPQFSAEQSFDRELEGLLPGDAFERTITFEGSDTMAMMLPAYQAEELTGLAGYPAPPVLDNYNNRGEVRARRVQSISYVVEAPGNYLLPGRDYFWWDTSSGELQLVSLPATEILVAGNSTAVTGAKRKRLQPRTIAIGVGGLALLGLLAWLLLRYRPWQWLDILAEPVGRLWDLLQTLRRPALPERLNPGRFNPDNNAGE
jgi:oxygen tolerance protein BatD